MADFNKQNYWHRDERAGSQALDDQGEEGELAPSMHSTSSQEQPDTTNLIVRQYPDKKISKGISRASDPNPQQFSLSDFDKVEKIGEGTFG
jgi:hypothetical protein